MHVEICSVTVIGTPVPDVGELNYFSEENGVWLQVTPPVSATIKRSE